MTLPASLACHRVSAEHVDSVRLGRVVWSPAKSLWFLGMVAGAIAGLFHFSWAAFFLFLATTGCVLLFGHSLGSHRRLIHGSYDCPKWLEYAFVYCGVQVGLAGPLGLMRQHELRDYAQRLPDCHDYLRHGRAFWIDAWWQLNCELRLARPPAIRIEPRVAGDRFYDFLERTWMAQQLPWAALFYLWGGWGFVLWGTCARVTAGVFGHWLIGYFAHNHGPMHYRVDAAAVQGHNVRFTSLITMGESWHNNHHAFPGSARLGLYPGEWDPGWWVLVLLRRAGLVWNLRLPQHLPARPEVLALEHAVKGITTNKPTIEWPASVMPAWAMRVLLGHRIELREDPTVMRLTFHDDGITAQGLPGLCLALERRSPRVASCLRPFANVAERMRIPVA